MAEDEVGPMEEKTGLGKSGDAEEEATTAA